MTKPQELPQPDEKFIRRFWKKINKTDGCWLWSGAISAHGYGYIKQHGQARLAHRVSWEMEGGPIPNGLFVCHRCDVRNCVNPKHLFLGTHDDNMQDASEKGRWACGEKQWMSKLTAAQVVEIRRLRSNGIKLKVIAEEFGVSTPTICQIINRKLWAHI